MIGEHEQMIRHTAVVVVADPEDVLPDGIHVRIQFRNAYLAKVFAKRCKELYRVAPF